MPYEKRTKRVLIVLIVILALCVDGFLGYTGIYYRAGSEAAAVMKQQEERGSVEVSGALTILRPEEPNGTGFIFYPGGKVEHTAYLPLLQKLQQRGITCVLVEMPFRLAVFDPARAELATERLMEVETWYIGGHSLGGAMACSYAVERPEQFAGVVLLGAYRYGDWPVADTLILYGSEDMVLDRTKLTEEDAPIVLQGGNHAGFGDYGPQKGDGVATITAQEQQDQRVEAIVKFMEQ